MKREEEKTPGSRAERGQRKELIGAVLSNKMEKTVTVLVTEKKRHPLYKKVMERSKKYYAHHEGLGDLAVGQRVRMMETRPLSKMKRWRVVEVLSSPASTVGSEL